MKDRFSLHRRTAAAAVPIGLALTAALAPGAQAATRPTVAGGEPAWTQAATSQGAAANSAPVDVRVYLDPKGGLQALDAAVAAVSTPGSPQYRQFLTSAQYRAQFAPTTQTVRQTEAFLVKQGFKIRQVEATHRWIHVTGTVATAERAFGTRIDAFRHDGDQVQAPTTKLTVPASLGGAVAAVSGLDTTPRKVTKAALTPPPAGFRNAKPCSTYYGQVQAKYQADFQTPLPKFQGAFEPYAPCGYVPAQYRAAYTGATALTGAGTRVGITDAYAAATILKDANTYATRHGDPAFAKSGYVQTQGGSFRNQAECDPTGWAGEETLDVEAVHGMAPGATVHYYGARSCLDDDFIDILDKVVDQNQVDVVSNSWSDVEEAESSDSVYAYEQAFKQGALQGIGFFFSSGDNGDEVANTGLRQVDYPASDPYATAIGGTSDAIGPDGSFEFQTGWGTDKYSLSSNGSAWAPVGFLYGAGGGFSTLFNRPAYQNGVVGAGSPAGRAVPDISADGDPNTGMLVGETQAFSDGTYYDEYRIGGTSLASPLMAGIQALAGQRAGGRLGFANPAIYAAAKNRTGTITDVKDVNGAVVRADYANAENPQDGIAYSIRTLNDDSSLAAGPGWDPVTGVGSPNAGYVAAPK